MCRFGQKSFDASEQAGVVVLLLLFFAQWGGLAFIGGDLEWKTAVFTELISQIDDALVMRVIVPADANRASLFMGDFEQFKDVHHGLY